MHVPNLGPIGSVEKKLWAVRQKKKRKERDSRDDIGGPSRGRGHKNIILDDDVIIKYVLYCLQQGRRRLYDKLK